MFLVEDESRILLLKYEVPYYLYCFFNYEDKIFAFIVQKNDNRVQYDRSTANIGRRKKKRACDFLVTHIQIAVLVLTGSPCLPIHLQFCTAKILASLHLVRPFISSHLGAPARHAASKEILACN